jgi:hypothetical protein
MVRCVRVARATAVKARTQAANALGALVVTAPAELGEQPRGLPTGRLAGTAARLRPGPILTVTAATKLACANRVSATWRWRPSWPRWTPSWTGAPSSQHLGCVGCAGSALRSPGRCWSPPGQPRAAAQRGRVLDAGRRLPDPGVLGQDGAASPEPRRQPPGQRRCTRSWWSGWVGSSRPATTLPAGPRKACRSGRSSGA